MNAIFLFEMTAEQQESEWMQIIRLPPFWPPYKNERIVLLEVLLPPMAGMAQEEAN